MGLCISHTPHTRTNVGWRLPTYDNQANARKSTSVRMCVGSGRNSTYLQDPCNTVGPSWAEDKANAQAHSSACRVP